MESPEGYDALRAGGIIGDRATGGAFGRPSREERTLGHAPDYEGPELRVAGDGGVEITRVASSVPYVTVERTMRRGASEQLITERRFGGASEDVITRLRGGASSLVDSSRRRRADEAVSFRPAH